MYLQHSWTWPLAAGMGARLSAGLGSPQLSTDTEFPTQVEWAARGIWTSAPSPSHCSTPWQRNHRNIHLEEELKSSLCFLLPLSGLKNSFQNFQTSGSLVFLGFSRSGWARNMWKQCLVRVGYSYFVFVVYTGPSTLWGYKKEQGNLLAVGEYFNVWLLTRRKFTCKFWEKASSWF